MQKEPYGLEEKLWEIQREAHISAALSILAMALLFVTVIGVLAAIIIKVLLT